MNEQTIGYIGIDIGTSYSSLSYYDIRNQQSIIIEKTQSIPSWLSFNKFKDEHLILYGERAKRMSDTKNTVYDILNYFQFLPPKFDDSSFEDELFKDELFFFMDDQYYCEIEILQKEKEY